MNFTTNAKIINTSTNLIISFNSHTPKFNLQFGCKYCHCFFYIDDKILNKRYQSLN